TRLGPGTLASWGYAAVDKLDPAQTALLLDPARTLGVRAISTFTTSPANAPVRRLFRFGDDMAGQIRALGATATDVQVTIIPPADVATTTRHLPIVAVAKTGPADAEAGSTAAYTIALHNEGSVEARSIVVTDTVTGVGSLTVSGAPTTLAADASGSASASYAI